MDIYLFILSHKRKISNEEWSSQLWTQFMQLCKEDWKKIQDFNGVWTRDLAIPVHEATDVEGRPIVAGSYVPVKGMNVDDV